MSKEGEVDEAGEEGAADIASQPGAKSGTKDDEETQASADAAASLGAVAKNLAQVLDKDLTALLGCQVSSSVGEAKVGRGSDLSLSGAVHVQQARCDDGPLQAVYLVCETSDAAMLGAIKAGGDADVAKAAREAGSLEEHADSFAEVVQLVSALLVSGFKKLEAGTLAVGECQTWEADDPPSFLSGICAAVAIVLEVEGHESATLHLVTDSEGSEDAFVLVLVEPDPDARERLEEAAENLDREITAIGPSELDEDAYDTMADADGIVVAWDLAGRSGLELIEHLAREPRTSNATLVLSHVQPSRLEVEAALRAGAHSLVLRPYDVEDLDAAIRQAKRRG